MNKLRWLVFITFMYTIIGIINVLYVQIPLIVLQFAWLFCLSMPWWNKTVKRWLRINE